ncbi:MULTISPECIES: hypothetical protein [unclassified Microbacterium]|uniref:hypothetical protein n=1 Tax=unclassified Microbacterium TaxID=2609290 RepID=UPI0034438DB5
MEHEAQHPQAGQTVQVEFRGGGHPQVEGSADGPVDFVVEDWWDHLTGKSWMFSDGNPAVIDYSIRSGMNGLPTDNEVVYGKVGAFGYLVHVDEIVGSGVTA